MSLFNIGLSGLNAANTGLSVTGHNVANVLTPGYSRERVGLTSQVSGSGMGDGVHVSNVERVADSYLQLQIQRQRAGFGFQQVNQQYMSKAEHLLNSDSTSISAGLDRYYAALNEASAQPQDIAHRQTIISQSQSMVRRFNNMSAQLESQSNQVNGQLDAAVSDANTMLASIASMNRSIRDAGENADKMTTLQDARDDALSKLSSMMEVHTTYNQDGTVSVTLDQGQPLVNGDTAGKLVQGKDGSMTLQTGSSRFGLNDNVGGTIGGLMHYRDGQLKDLQQDLDVMAYSFANQFNDQHTKGTDLDGNPGKPLFGGVDQIEGAAKRLNLQINDPRALALAGTGTSAAPGNSDNLQAMIALKNTSLSVDTSKLPAGEADTYKNAIGVVTGKPLYGVYTGLTGDWAIQTAQFKADTDAAKDLVKQAESDRESVSGVNLDEEAVNIMTYTQMYQANSKVISTAQRLLDITMNMFN